MKTSAGMPGLPQAGMRVFLPRLWSWYLVGTLFASRHFLDAQKGWIEATSINWSDVCDDASEKKT